jgi:hypothetical protein
MGSVEAGRQICIRERILVGDQTDGAVANQQRDDQKNQRRGQQKGVFFSFCPHQASRSRI